MSNFSVGDEVCLIPLRDRTKFMRESMEGRKLKILAISDFMVHLEGWPSFYRSGRQFSELLVLWSEATPAQRAGLCEGDRVEVTKEYGGSPDFYIGDILRLEDDDGSRCPYFVRESDGEVSPEFIEIRRGVSPMEFTRLLSDEPEEKKELTSEQKQVVKFYQRYFDNAGADDNRPLSAQEQAYQDKQDSILADNQKLIEATRKREVDQSRIISGLVDLPEIPKNGRF